MAGHPRIFDLLACSSHSGALPILVHVRHERTLLPSSDTANTVAGCHTERYEYTSQKEKSISQPSCYLFCNSCKPTLRARSSVCSNAGQAQGERHLDARQVRSARQHTRDACPDTSGTASHPHTAPERVDNSRIHPCTDRRCSLS